MMLTRGFPKLKRPDPKPAPAKAAAVIPAAEAVAAPPTALAATPPPTAPIDTRAVLEALGADPQDCEVIQLLDRLLTALRDGETIAFSGDAVKLAKPGDWGTLTTPVCRDG